MAKQQRYNIKWKDVQFVAGGSDTIDLPIGLMAESIQLYFQGTITNTVAWAGVRSEGIAKLIKRVQIMINGETIHELSGEALTHGNFARKGGVIKANPLPAVGVQNVEVVGFLDMAAIAHFNPKDSILNTRGARMFQLRIVWGQLADVFTGAGTSTAALTLSALVRQTKEFGDEFGYVKEPEVRRLTRFTERPYTSSTVDRFQLDPNVMYRGLVLRCESGGELSTAVLNNVRVMVGSEIPFDAPAPMIVDMNLHDNEFSLPPGYYFIDFAPAAGGMPKMSDFLDLYGHSDAYLVLDANGGPTNKVQIVSHEFEWLTGSINRNAQHLVDTGQA